MAVCTAIVSFTSRNWAALVGVGLPWHKTQQDGLGEEATQQAWEVWLTWGWNNSNACSQTLPEGITCRMWAPNFAWSLKSWSLPDSEWPRLGPEKGRVLDCDSFQSLSSPGRERELPGDIILWEGQEPIWGPQRCIPFREQEGGTYTPSTTTKSVRIQEVCLLSAKNGTESLFLALFSRSMHSVFPDGFLFQGYYLYKSSKTNLQGK